MFSIRDFLPERSTTGQRVSFRNLDINNSTQLKNVVLGGLLVLSGSALRRSIIGLAMVIGGGSVIHRALAGGGQSEAAARSDQEQSRSGVPIHKHRISKSIIIHRPSDEVYRFFRNLENAPRFIKSVESVQVLDDACSFWIARTPIGDTIESYVEISDDQPEKLISWKSVPDGEMEHSGTIRFESVDNGSSTLLTVNFEFRVRHTEFADDVARILHESPDEQLLEDLGRLRLLLEAGPQTIRIDKLESAT